MNFSSLLIMQVAAHLLTDYTFQSDGKAKEKNRDGFRSPFLKWHVLMAFVLSWALSWQLAFVFAAMVIALLHWVIDGFKPYLNVNTYLSRYSFFIDQVLHLLIVSGAVMLHQRVFGTTGTALNTQYAWTVLGYLACSKPANIFIKEVISVFGISVKPGSNEAELPNAGKLIGVLERWLVFTFIVTHHFEAIGFLIAAKSILRFKDTDTLKTEYVLIGTMLSFGIAIVLGLAAVNS